VLKHLYKQDRLDFASHWIAKEEDYSIETATAAAIQVVVKVYSGEVPLGKRPYPY
jgi:hypothetical protein